MVDIHAGQTFENLVVELDTLATETAELRSGGAERESANADFQEEVKGQDHPPPCPTRPGSAVRAVRRPEEIKF